MRYFGCLVALLIFQTSAAWAQAVDQAELLRRIQLLEQRVDRLEQIGKPVPPVLGGSLERSSWRSLKRGMTTDQVRALLGEAQRIQMYGPMTVWEYPSNGSVWFGQRDLLEQIHEPRGGAATAPLDAEQYIAAIRSRIKRFIVEPPGIPGNPEVEIQLEMAPGGEVLNATITRASGQPAWDEAAVRGIQRAQPLPLPPQDSTIFNAFKKIQLRFRPK